MTPHPTEYFSAMEVGRTDCFLCRPAARLIVDVAESSFTIAGIGPLTSGYAIVSTIEHLDHLRDKTEIEQFAAYVSRIRSALNTAYGSCVLTEHGHSPICTLAHTQTVHCFHPHVLMFPGTPEIEKNAAQCFKEKPNVFSSLYDALIFGSTLNQYFLVSDTSTSFSVYSAEGGLPRQFARVLVAEKLGLDEQASWRDFPKLREAQENASILKVILKGDS